MYHCVRITCIHPLPPSCPPLPAPLVHPRTPRPSSYDPVILAPPSAAKSPTLRCFRHPTHLPSSSAPLVHPCTPHSSSHDPVILAPPRAAKKPTLRCFRHPTHLPSCRLLYSSIHVLYYHHCLSSCKVFARYYLLVLRLPNTVNT